jgi:hypothetical protein
LDDQIEDEMGGACGTYGKEEEKFSFWSGNLRESNHLQDLGINERIILKWI